MNEHSRLAQSVRRQLAVASSSFLNLAGSAPGLIAIGVLFLSLQGTLGANLALTGTASQSSTAYGGLASRAIDGNRDGVFTDNSVTHTDPNGTNEYWITDLGGTKVVESITLWNRADCCGARMSNLRVSLLDAGSNVISSADILNANPVSQGGARSFPLPYGSTGRYVKVASLPGLNADGNNIISIAECEIWGHDSLVNLARHPLATVSQSSTLAPAALANDGNTDPNFNDGSVAFTDPSVTTGTWWQVQFGTLATINEIWLFNRNDCCGERLGNFRLSVFNGATEVFGTNYFVGSNSVPQGAAFSNVFAAPVQGTAVRIALLNNVNNTGDSSLALTEVEVFGDPGPDVFPPQLVQVTGASNNTILIQFSEPVTPGTATNLANYAVTSTNGPVSLLSATISAYGDTVTLSTVPFAYGLTYTVTVNSVTDRSPATNMVAANSRLTFQATPVNDIGSPALGGSVVNVSGGYDLSGAGTDIGGVADQFTFLWTQRTGDFDVKVRLATLGNLDVWTKAGLMARETLDPGSRFAAALATPGLSGAFFETRTATNGTTTTLGNGPVVYPNTWLRLVRSGNAYTGYVSLNGTRWMSLGSTTLSMPSAYLGLAVCSHAPNTLATAQFRDYGAASGGEFGTITLPNEPLGPSSRSTPIAITEIMYHARVVPGITNSFEFIEFYNSQGWEENIGGYHVTGSIDYTFPTNTIIKSGQFIVLARDPGFLQTYYGIPVVFGPWLGAEANGLPNNNGSIRLRNRAGAVLLDIPFQADSPWPIGADGAGYSLILARPSYGEGDPAAWAASARVGGSPGRPEPLVVDPQDGALINEFLANSLSPQEDYIEVYNHTKNPLNLSGAWLSDQPDTNKFRVPDGVILPPGAFVSFTESVLGFRIKASGDHIYLVNSNQDHLLDAVQFEAQSQGISSGRCPDGSPYFYPLAAQTPGTNNGAQLFSDIVINELMYAPISGDSDDEFIELYNRSASPVNLGGWKFAAGVTYVFPANTILAPDGYLVVARNSVHLRTNYGNLNPTNCLGNYNGSLGNGGARVALARPEFNVSTNASGFVTNLIYVVVNEVTYDSGGRWGNWSAGGGSSLELKDSHSDTRLAANWADSDETTKSVWSTIQFTGTLGDLQSNPTIGSNNYVYLFLLGPGECLLDDVDFNYEPGTNLVPNAGFELGAVASQVVNTNDWTAEGAFDMSTTEAGGWSGAKCLHVRGSSRGDTGANRIRSGVWTPGPASGKVTIKAQARWLCGWPELLVRLHTGGAEAGGRMQVPSNLGTPGARNSRALSNAGPPIVDVAHSPLLPLAGEPVVITARPSDPDGLASVQLNYRYDPSGSYITVAMRDDGGGGDAVAGDGLYTATITGQGAGTLLAFYVRATDRLGASNTFPQNLFPVGTLPRCFPDDSLSHECLVRWGEVQMPGNLATYHVWQTSANSNRWYNRDNLSNAELDNTFIYHNCRAVYNAAILFSGSPFHRGNMTTGPSGLNRCDYILRVPSDDSVLGESDFNLCIPGNANGGTDTTSDPSAMAEQLSFHLFTEMGVPSMYRRFMHLFFNGNQRSAVGNYPGNFIYEDCQQPNGSVIKEWYPNDTGGELCKADDWFEFNDNATAFLNNDADFQRREIVANGSNTVNLARYRFMWRKRSLNAGDSANNFTNFQALLNAVSPTTNDAATVDYPRFNAVFNTEEMMREIAVEHTVGNYDSYGYSRGKNNYTYIPTQGRWELIPWDVDWTMGQTGGRAYNDDLFSGASDPRMTALYKTPEVRRAYLRAFKDLIYGPFCNAFLDRLANLRMTCLSANNINFDAADVQLSKTYTTQRSNFLASVLATNGSDMPFTDTTPAYQDSSSNTVTISGTAPLEVETVMINGQDYPIAWIPPSGQAWLTATNWSVTVPLTSLGTNILVVQGYNRTGNALPGMTFTNRIRYTGVPESPIGRVVINEIMFNPLVPEAEYVELFNVSSNTSFDLSGWNLHGIGYTFPTGSVITARSFLVLARNPYAYYSAYGGVVPAYDQFPGNLQTDGETLALIQPGLPPAQDTVIDQIRYEAVAPWPLGSNGVPTAASIQLIDPNQDRTRPCNWATIYSPAVFGPGGYFPATTNAGWRFVTVTGTAPVTTPSRFSIQIGEVGDMYLDDIILVPGSVPGVGANYVRNGDFETAIPEIPMLTNSWFLGTNYRSSALSTTVKHGGNSALHLVCLNTTNSGVSYMVYSNLFYQYLSPAPPANQTLTLSFWYLATTNATNLTVKLLNGPTALTNVNPSVSPGSNTVPALLTNAVFAVTPGTNNTFTTNLAPMPPLWLNEVQPNNLSGVTDASGTHEPWVELFNSGSNTITLTNLFLTDSYTNLTNWAFPAGVTIGPGQFKLIFCDGQSNQTTSTEWHTRFRLPTANGSVALTYLSGGKPLVLDYLNYADLGPDRSFGDYPDGQLIQRQVFFYATPGGTNDGTSPPLTVFINEWMAANQLNLPNPVGGKYDDWIELYNPTDTPQNLAGYYLTDTFSDPFQDKIPSGYVVPAHGYLLVWADGKPSRNSTSSPDLHVSFQLSKDGESIGLFAADGHAIDTVTFGLQTNDVSQGRFPDGGSHIYYMTTPTPRQANYLPNTAPVIQPIPNQTNYANQLISVQVMATDAEAPQQTLTYTLDPGAPVGTVLDPVTGLFTWTPLSAQAPGSYPITVRVTDNGPVAMSSTATFQVTVLANSAPVVTPINRKVVHLGQTLSFLVGATDAEAPPQVLTFSLDPGCPQGTSMDATTGRFTWTPLPIHTLGSYPITVRVTDNGLPPLSGSVTFTVQVMNQLALSGATLDDTQLVLTWASAPGMSYRVESRDSLTSGAWSLVETVTATTEATSYSVSTTSTDHRFYRVTAAQNP